MGSSPFSLLPRPFSLLGLTRGGDGVKIRVRVSLFDSIRPIRFSVLLISFSFRSSKWGSRVRVRFRPLFFFFLWISFISSRIQPVRDEDSF